MARPTVAPERRAQIVRAVIEILCEEGWDGLTLRRISEVSGLSNGAVSHFAGRKEEMIAEAVRRHYAGYRRRAEEVTEGGTPQEQIENWVNVIVAPGPENQREWACWAALWGRAPFDEAIESELKIVYRLHSRSLALVIEDGVASGDFHPSRPAAEIADDCVAMIDGLALRRTVDPKAFPPSRVRNQTLRFLNQELQK